jgi:dipeptidase
VDGDAGTDDAPVADTAPAVEAEQNAAKGEPKAEPATLSVTQDDITKIIVQKLKKDRSNNEKIGAILKTYGVAKVSELPAEKYEAFLTDLSQL